MVRPMWHDEFQEALKKNLDQKKARNQAFSMRSFAQRLKLSPGALSEMLRGQRKVSVRKAVEILSLLPDGEPALLRRLEEILKMEQAGTERILLPEEAHKVVSKWQYLALTMLFNCDNKLNDAGLIAQRLGLSFNEVSEALDLLMANGLVRKNEQGFFESTGAGWRTTDGIPSSVIRASHVDGLKLSEKAIQELPLAVRDFTYIVFPADQRKLEDSRKEVRRFIDRMTSLMQGESTNSVYRLAVQLFPLDQWEKKNEVQ